MKYNLHVIRTADFVRLDARGNPDLAETRRALEVVAKACIDRGANAALLDVRDARSDLRLVDLYGLVTAFPAMGFRREHRLAILHRYSGAERAEFFAMCAAERGWHVRAFDNYEEATEWFGTEIPVVLDDVGARGGTP
jgi:hypothetical protein